MSFPRRFARLLRLLPFAVLAAVPAVTSAACNAQLATVLASDASADARSSGGAACTQDPECNHDPNISTLLGHCTGNVCVCNLGSSSSPDGKCVPGTTTGDAAPTDDCVAKGGICTSEDLPPPPDRHLAGAGQGTCPSGNACYLRNVDTPVPVCAADADCNGDSKVSTLWGTCFKGVCMCKAGYTVQPNGKCNVPPAPDCTTQGGTCRSAPATCQAGELGSAPPTDMSCGDFIAAVCCNQVTKCRGPAVDFVCCKPNDGSEAPLCVNGWKTCGPADEPAALPGGCQGG